MNVLTHLRHATLFILACAALHADPALIAKARAFIGNEAALNAVQALRFTGELVILENDQPLPGSAKLEILFQKPYRQRITAIGEGKIEVTALDGYDAWQRITDQNDRTLWQVTLLGPDQIKLLRANTFENLAFFRGIEHEGGRIEDGGTAVVDGIQCRRLLFIHGPGIVFTRNFDVTTGRLVLTETASGTSIREEGELRAGGLRFPKRIHTTSQLPDGGTRTIRVTFDSVEVNPTIEPDAFAVPLLVN